MDEARLKELLLKAMQGDTNINPIIAGEAEEPMPEERAIYNIDDPIVKTALTILELTPEELEKEAHISITR